MTTITQLSPTTFEHSSKSEDEARTARRVLINRNIPVSLLSYDGSRDLYVFDSYK